MKYTKLYLNAPGPNDPNLAGDIRDAALDRAVDVGARGVRSGMNPFFANPPNNDPDTDLLEAYIDACANRNLAVHLLFYPTPDQVTEAWQDLYGVGIPWTSGVTGQPPNQRRPPAGATNQVWAEIVRQVDIMIEAAHDRWAFNSMPSSMLTFEFANEPWCGGAFGLEVGVDTAVKGTTKTLERGDLDNAFHDMARYMLATLTGIDFRGHKVYSPPMPSAIDVDELDRQIDTMFYSASGYDAYRNLFEAWSFNVYPRIDHYNVTGAYACHGDALERALRILAALRSSPASTFVGSKPIAIQETGVGAYLGGFLDSVGGSDVPQVGRPYWYQEQGRYLAALADFLMGTEVERVGLFTLVEPLKPDDPPSKWFVEEGSYGMMERDLVGGNAQHRGSLNALGRTLGQSFSGGLAWVLRTSNGEVWLDGGP
jgi:hypothetical protein